MRWRVARTNLQELRNELNLQDQRLRQQRRDIQMWADRRYDEIESRVAKIIVRERELDQLESEFQRQSLQWQQQREVLSAGNRAIELATAGTLGRLNSIPSAD